MVVERLIESPETGQYADLPDELVLEWKELADKWKELTDRSEAFRQNRKQAPSAKSLEVEPEEEKSREKRRKKGYALIVLGWQAVGNASRTSLPLRLKTTTPNLRRARER